MGWGTSWDKPDNHQLGKLVTEPTKYADKDIATLEEAAAHGWPRTIIYPATSEFPAKKFDGMVTVDLDKNGNITEEGKDKILKDIQNKFPTHDPYTNPNAFIYYECECGQILDPKTKRFAELNNHASNAGWKIRWGSQSYIPYCVECAKEKGIE